MPINKEDRKEYNKQYYSKNKEIILKKASERVECEICGRNVSKNHYIKHLTNPICLKKAQLKQKIENIKTKLIENE